MSRIRKDRLSKFLAALVWRRHGEQIKSAEKLGAATAAVLHLTAKNPKAACDALMQENDFHLALLVAQIEQADDGFQDDIADQLTAWHRQGVLSEITEEVRAVYEILSGSTTICQGKQNVPVEDRAVTFAISEKFELDWLQAFGLCLWYGRWKNGDIHDAVVDFEAKLMAHAESASPADAAGNEDPLWVLLKLFASRASSGKGSAAEPPIFPQALSSLSQPWNSKLAFQLYHTLAATVSGATLDHAKADDLAMSLAFEQSARGDIVGAVYALLHIEDPTKRAREIQDLLNRHAASLPSPDDVDSQPHQAQLWSALTGSLKVPSHWLCHAKALHARSSNAPLAELNFLLLAHDFVEAHECLLRRVAPRLVIDEDWETLGDVLAKFGAEPETKVDGWNAGGSVYADFVALVDLLGRHSSNAEAHQPRKALLQRLQPALASLNAKFAHAATADGWSLDKDREKLEERVALCEMGRAVARALEFEDERGRTDMVGHLSLPIFARSCC
jgi:nuclear pore complex protein Nup98-Nup96